MLLLFFKGEKEAAASLQILGLTWFRLVDFTARFNWDNWLCGFTPSELWSLFDQRPFKCKSESRKTPSSWDDVNLVKAI